MSYVILNRPSFSFVSCFAIGHLLTKHFVIHYLLTEGPCAFFGPSAHSDPQTPRGGGSSPLAPYLRSLLLVTVWMWQSDNLNAFGKKVESWLVGKNKVIILWLCLEVCKTACHYLCNFFRCQWSMRHYKIRMGCKSLVVGCSRSAKKKKHATERPRSKGTRVYLELTIIKSR